MPADPVQLSLALFEFALMLAGLALVVKFCGATARARWLDVNRLTRWEITPYEFVVFVGLMLMTGFVLQLGLQIALGSSLASLADRRGTEIVVYGVGFSGGSILGWLFFQRLRRSWYADYGTQPPVAEPPRERLSWPRSIVYGAVTLLLALPLVSLASIGWNFLLRVMGLPEEPQPLIGIFAETESAWVLLGMLVVACVLAPLSEELLFRGGIYRFLRQRTGRSFALIASGLLFGAMHGNWAGLLPLSLLGALLAVAYEATGDIRVPIVAHALFNFNTVIIVISGLSELGP